jgi:hypothetical protein
MCDLEETTMRTIHILSVAVAFGCAGGGGATEGTVTPVPLTPPSYADSLEIPKVMSAALGTIRAAFPFGRVLLDRTVIDTTKRLAPPLMSGREHPLPEDWAKPNEVEAVQTSYIQASCRSGNVDCALPAGIAGVIAFSDPTVRGDDASVVVRYYKTTGSDVVARVSTYVEDLRLHRTDGVWKVIGRRIRASA